MVELFEKMYRWSVEKCYISQKNEFVKDSIFKTYKYWHRFAYDDKSMAGAVSILIFISSSGEGGISFSFLYTYLPNGRRLKL